MKNKERENEKGKIEKAKTEAETKPFHWKPSYHQRWLRRITKMIPHQYSKGDIARITGTQKKKSTKDKQATDDVQGNYNMKIRNF